MTRLQGEIVAQGGGNASIPSLKKFYERHSSKCNELEDPAEEEELRQTREYCLRAFLLFSVGVTIFANKSNKHVSLI